MYNLSVLSTLLWSSGLSRWVRNPTCVCSIHAGSNFSFCFRCLSRGNLVLVFFKLFLIRNLLLIKINLMIFYKMFFGCITISLICNRIRGVSFNPLKPSGLLTVRSGYFKHLIGLFKFMYYFFYLGLRIDIRL